MKEPCFAAGTAMPAPVAARGPSAAWRPVALAVLLFLSSTAPIAGARPEVPRLQGPVTDLAGLLTAAQEADLTARLAGLEQDTGAQVAVLTVPRLDGEPIESFAIEVARAWALGQEGRDNGLLILVAVEERELRIEVGEGLEGAVTDLASKRVIDERMVPRFREGDFGAGIVAAVEALDPVIRGEPMPEVAPEGGDIAKVLFLTVFYLVIAVLGLAAQATGGTFAAGVYGAVIPFSYIFPLVLAGPFVAWFSLGLWSIGFPILYFTWGRALRERTAGDRTQGSKAGRRKDGWLDGWTNSSSGRGGGGWGGSGGSSGGWSGGGGSFGGGGASGKW